MEEGGHRVLLTDFDPQSSLSDYFGLRDGTHTTTKGILSEQRRIEPTDIQKVSDNISIIPSGRSLVDLDVGGQLGEGLLAKTLEGLNPRQYDYLLIDTAPSLGNLLYEALLAANYCLIPMLPEYMSIQGWRILERIIWLAKQEGKKNLVNLGIAVVNYDSRTTNAKEMYQYLKDELAGQTYVYKTIIPRAVAIAEAAIVESPITKYEPNSQGANQYRTLTDEILGRINRRRS